MVNGGLVAPSKAALIQARPKSARVHDPTQFARGPTNAGTSQPSILPASTAAASKAHPTSPPQKHSDNPGPSNNRDRSSRRDITIHVFDENRNSKRDFHCKKSALLREMKYFTSYIDEKHAGDYVEIDVHCDIEVFEWLMAHISRGKKEGPPLCTRTVISILISSSFLQMAKLTEDCLEYCHQHLSEVVTVPLDMNCISEKLLARLAGKFSVVELSQVVDKRDKVLGKLYMYKTVALLSDPKNPLRRCELCRKLYAESKRCALHCEIASPAIDFRGNSYAWHERDPSFSVNCYVAELRRRGLTWKETFYRVWGFFAHLHCATCCCDFPIREFGCCYHHRSEIMYPPGEGKGFYPCCLRPQYRFHPFDAIMGCEPRDHVVEDFEKEAQDVGKGAGTLTVGDVLVLLEANRSIIVRPRSKSVLSRNAIGSAYSTFLDDAGERTAQAAARDDEDAASTGSKDSGARRGTLAPPRGLEFGEFGIRPEGSIAGAALLTCKTRSARWAHIGRPASIVNSTAPVGAADGVPLPSSQPARRRRAILDAYPEQDRTRTANIAAQLLKCRMKS